MPKIKELGNEERAQIVALYKAGKNPKSIKKILFKNPNYPSLRTIRRICAEYVHTGDFHKLHRSGRPRCTTTKMDEYIIGIHKKTKMNSRRLKEFLKSMAGVSISYRTICRRFHERGGKWRRLTKVQKLTTAQKKARIRYALKHLRTDWTRVVFSDETQHALTRTGHWRWVFPGEDGTEEAEAHPLKVHWWSYVDWYGVGPLVEVKGRLNSAGYVNILKKYLLPHLLHHPKKRMKFLQDSATIHTSHYTKQFFVTNGVRVIEHPVKSPDLNIIENTWAYMKDKVESRAPSTRDELVQYTKDEWKNIPLHVIRNTIKSMPNRLKSVIRNSGEAIKK